MIHVAKRLSGAVTKKADRLSPTRLSWMFLPAVAPRRRLPRTSKRRSGRENATCNARDVTIT